MQEKNIDSPKKSGETPPDISIVVPLLNEEQSLGELADQIKKALAKANYNYEILFIDDGSTDRSWEIIEQLAEDRDEIIGIRLRRNYGKSDALQTGFERSIGRFVVTMDADLQDDPNEIPAMIEKLENGADLVSGWKKKRHDPISKTIPSRFFNAVTRWVTGIKLHDFNCGLKAYRKEVVENISLYGEMHRYVPLLAKWEGFGRIEEQVVQHHPRKYGNTKFGISRFLNGFLDLVTLLFINRYVNRPMHFFGLFGVLFLFVGIAINLYLAYIKIFLGEPLANRPLLFLGLLLVMVGVQFFSIGFLGELLNRGDERNQKPNVAEITES
ncbi:glycosyltransferase family 2 protein [Rhodohalobacter sp.]|uniref:glycosyltransferase family 2 protein n=1 Tax=Rhodohalobacter sp. TaxID=1974210 RepID=UPI002ACD5EE5|nr:glycosyltransferase family 2 protein [Rhodohalobacter sp.]MDZ7756704.1 glycosyltransferase family 2 protein [Rhodohalobacter sp.]